MFILRIQNKITIKIFKNISKIKGIAFSFLFFLFLFIYNKNTFSSQHNEDMHEKVSLACLT